MAPKQHENTPARRAALQALYTSEITGESASALVDQKRFLEEEELLGDYTVQLVHCVEAHRLSIDEQLESTSDNWALSRMPIVDRCILRISVCEMMFIDEVPTSVSINEAVELAKDFGGEDESPRFVNGVLGRIARKLAGEDETAESEAEEPEAVEPEAAAEAEEAPAADEAAAE